MLYTLFRHKRLIIGFMCLGVAGAAAVRVAQPPKYVSTAKVMVQYVLDTRTVNPANAEVQSVKQVDPGAASVLANEVEILTTLDVAAQAAQLVTPERIMAKLGGGTNAQMAAGAIAAGIEVEPPKTSTLTVSFKHPDGDVAREVLAAVIQSYMMKHRVIHLRTDLEESYRQQVQEMRTKLAQTEEERKQILHQANVIFPEATEKSYQEQISKTQTDLLDAQRELAERKAVLGDSVPSGALEQGKNSLPANSVPSQKLSDYSEITTELEQLKKTERELLLTYKPEYPTVVTVRAQIQKLTGDKAELEKEFPSLATLALGGQRGSTNIFGGDVATQLGEIRRLEARIGALEASLTKIRSQASQVMEMEPKIAEITRRRDEEQKSYEAALASYEAMRRDDSQAAGKANNITIVENPTPARRDYKKLLKLMGMVLATCAGAGFGLAFLIDFVLDRSIKRTQDVERHLRLPVFLSIPDTAWTGSPKFPKWLARMLPLKSLDPGHDSNSQKGTGLELTAWRQGDELQNYAEGLRERLMTYFEVSNLNLKKPKLVALTGCGEGSGTTTLASGLAAALSKTGDGNVLLVDMNGDQGVAHSFYKGQPGCGLKDALEPESRAEAQVQDNLYLASIHDNQSGALSKLLPNRFTHLVPKLKASDYDYIIFDMPPVSPTSATPRLASYMDIVLLVLESEKTGQHSATRAAGLMRDARANVAAVLNKCRRHVPAALSHEL